MTMFKMRILLLRVTQILIIVMAIYFELVTAGDFYIQEYIKEDSLPLSNATKINAASQIQCVLKCQRRGENAFISNKKGKGECYCINGPVERTNVKTNYVYFQSIDDKIKVYAPGKNENNPGTSCKSLKEQKPSLESGFYWVQLDKPSRVYCDMKTDGGGWMVVANVTIENGQDITFPASSLETDSSKFDQVSSGNFRASTTMLKEISSYIDIQQFRLFCSKPSVGTTIHFSTKTNEDGLTIRDYIFSSNPWTTTTVGCPDILNIYPSDTSTFSKACSHGYEYWVSKPEGVALSERLYSHAIYVAHEYHINLVDQRAECDDHYLKNPSYVTEGRWMFFVR